LHQIESVAQPLRAALRAEKASFLEQIEFLQTCMEEENDAYVHVTNVAADAAAPTLTELRSMNSKLEKAWLDQGVEDPLQAALNKVPTSESRFSAKGTKPPLPSKAMAKKGGRMASKLRSSIQDARDEGFLES